MQTIDSFIYMKIWVFQNKNQVELFEIRRRFEREII
jgi:putative flippase GtrA